MPTSLTSGRSVVAVGEISRLPVAGRLEHDGLDEGVGLGLGSVEFIVPEIAGEFFEGF